MKKMVLTAAVVIATIASAQAQTVVYVDVNATGASNGSSWANAYFNLNTAINNSSPGSEFWVKAGTYNQQFDIYDDATIIGGFNGTESSASQADPAANVVIFDGDVDGDDLPGVFSSNRNDNFSYLCRILPSNDSAAMEVRISGITFKGSNSASSNAALFISNGTNDNASKTVNVKNCIFEDNGIDAQDAGGAAVRVWSNNANSYTTATFDKCVFRYNGTYGTNNVRGSAMFIYASNYGTTDCKITNCLFNDNIDVAPYSHSCVIYQATSSSGGSSTSQLYNNTFVYDYNSGHPVWYWNGSAASSATGYFWNNVVDSTYGALHVGSPGTSSNLYVINAFNNLWATSLVNETAYSPTQGNNIISSSPDFVNAPGGYYQLTAASPCVNAGNPQTASGNLLPDNLDLAGNPRFYAGGTVDIGALEYQGVTGIHDPRGLPVVKLHPNPASSMLNIELQEATNARIVNVLGETVGSAMMGAGKNTVDVTRLSSGVYFLQTENGRMQRFVKE